MERREHGEAKRSTAAKRPAPAAQDSERPTAKQVKLTCVATPNTEGIGRLLFCLWRTIFAHRQRAFFARIGSNPARFSAVQNALPPHPLDHYPRELPSQRFGTGAQELNAHLCNFSLILGPTPKRKNLFVSVHAATGPSPLCLDAAPCLSKGRKTVTDRL